MLVPMETGQAALTGAERQTRRVWLQDGLDELMGAGMALAAAATLIALRSSPLFFPDSLLVFGLGPLTQLWLFARLKARIADPRSGYVRPPLLAPGRFITRLSPRAARLIVVGVGFACGTIPFLDARLPGPPVGTLIWWAAVVGSAGLAVYAAQRTGLRRIYLYALVPPAVTAGRIVGLDDDLLAIAFLVAYGLIALVGGSLALRSYLRTRPLPVAH